MKIPFLDLQSSNSVLRAEMIDAFTKFHDSYIYIQGNCLKEFEEKYSYFNNVNHTIGVSNGLDAIYLSLKALEVGPGDEVIIPSNTFIATVMAVSYTGASPIFVEPDKDSYLIDSDKIQYAISSKTKVIIPVHLYGQACEMDKIISIANENSLKVIEDNAQAHGATFKGRITGSFGEINATSFYPGKNLGAYGDAGAVTTNDPYLAEKVAMLRNYGSRDKYIHEIIGHNMRMDELQAALLLVKLRYLDQATQLRKEIAEWYNEALQDFDPIVLPKKHPDASHVYHLYVIRTKLRDALKEYLYHQGIGTLIHYPIPPHLQKAYAYLGHSIRAFPISEELADTSLSLPIWPGMTRNQVNFVADKIRSFWA